MPPAGIPGPAESLTFLALGSFGIGPWNFQLQMRHIDSSILNTTWVEGVDVDDNTVPSSTWFNGQIGYNGESAGRASTRLGIIASAPLRPARVSPSA